MSHTRPSALPAMMIELSNQIVFRRTLSDSHIEPLSHLIRLPFFHLQHWRARVNLIARHFLQEEANAFSSDCDTAGRDNLHTRWKEIQTNFVDEPRKAVEQADGLVASAMKRLAEVFADERSKLEKQWDRGDNVSTEDLRVAFQRYRSFFDRLLSV